MTEIRFYRANEKPYGMFSNLLKRPIEQCRDIGRETSSSVLAVRQSAQRRRDIRCGSGPQCQTEKDTGLENAGGGA